jgi:hypothetical protein
VLFSAPGSSARSNLGGWSHALLLATGSILFSPHRPPPLQPSAAPHFNPIVSTCSLLPLVEPG